MNKDIALKILEINNNNDLFYEEKMNQLENIVGANIETHTNIKTGGAYGKRNCCILEAYKTLNNFQSRQWISSDSTSIVVSNAIPIQFKILTKDNKIISYSLYNADQLQYRVLFDSIEKAFEKIDEIIKENNYYEYSSNLLANILNVDQQEIVVSNSSLSLPLKNLMYLYAQKHKNVVYKKENDIAFLLTNKAEDNKNTSMQNDIINTNNEEINIKNFLLQILDKETISTARNIEIFKIRYLYNKTVETYEDIGEGYNLTRERIRQIISKIIKRIHTKCRIGYRVQNNGHWCILANHLQMIKIKLEFNAVENIVETKFIRELLTEEFGDDDIRYLNLINGLLGTDFKTHQETYAKNSDDTYYSNSKIKKAILACIREFNGQYGRSGIAKILKGSQGLKDNEHNNDSLKSKYYGMFKQLTLSFITSEIDELIKDEMLVTSKVSFGRPILNINPKYADEIDDLDEDNDINVIENDNDDENISRVLYLIRQHKNVFITGHAGTGKSYILSKLKGKMPQLVITSTTGIAAVNVKGQTLHSWAGIGICNRPIELTVEKILQKSSLKKQIQKCKLLAIDEISMLDIKTFEYTDKVLRQVRSCDEPFGGIQVIFIGDFFQLPPVEKNENNKQKYCFESTLWNDLDLHTVLLTKNYRQNEENLIMALSHMRTNALTDDDITLLKTREYYGQDKDIQNALHIFATNLEADNYNNLKYKNIDAQEYKLFAIDGLYKGEKIVKEAKNAREENILKRIDVVCSAEKSISLKIGVRVMLLINLDFEKGLINGSCGTVVSVYDDCVVVNFDNGKTSEIKKHDFEFYNNDVLIAVRQQFPLRLAYGITIHKSQGMSLDKLVVDCSRIFEKGQAYVALSRIKTLNGLYLRNFDRSKVMVDDIVVEFYKNLKIFDKKIESKKSENIVVANSNNSIKTSIEENIAEAEHNTEYYVNKIKNIILGNNRWIEIYEIANILGVDRHTKLVESEFNSTIAHLINRYLKKEGFVTKKINYEHGYSIVVAPPDFDDDTIPQEILTIPYSYRK